MTLAPTAGIGFKPQHADDVFACASPALWLEIHPENYAVDGGPRLALLDALASRFPLSLHGVSLSLAGETPPDPVWLRRLRTLIERTQPVLVSEHLAWSSWDGNYLPDLLPFPRTHEALSIIVEHVDRTQTALGRRISLENPSHYLPIDGHEWSETAFLSELARRTGCGLLLDINNVHVSARNLAADAHDYIDAFPLSLVTEIHLAGHAFDEGLEGLLIDSHDAPVATEVWDLYSYTLQKTGPVPTLIERDGNVPSFPTLLAERDIAQAILANAHGRTP
ncbi:uncharacterized protein (UPF0276 family) [Luteibacter sp. 1214]|uniref:MNIO family bufferin maturase n=1 Tax=Luteibacter sp. 1214 TaxID=2817735 RepID=UPI002859B2CC|nr:DUF692 domain-containing protein [Luteibacter sp. 1214]MDR6641624.1 uncharacterized protein (UPF0276 family) [Luteibacter sp. 1214]